MCNNVYVHVLVHHFLFSLNCDFPFKAQIAKRRMQGQEDIKRTLLQRACRSHIQDEVELVRFACHVGESFSQLRDKLQL